MSLNDRHYKKASKFEGVKVVNDDTGEVRIVTPNALDFCRENDISYGGFMKMLNGNQNFHKGWRLYTTDPKKPRKSIRKPLKYKPRSNLQSRSITLVSPHGLIKSYLSVSSAAYDIGVGRSSLRRLIERSGKGKGDLFGWEILDISAHSEE